MLANWVKQATATTGTGTMTLGSAETSYVTFGDQFNDGDVVYYSIEDGNDREIGIGTYTVAGTTLSRDTVLETLVSGTFDNTSPAAITLSGSAIVSVSGSSYSQLPTRGKAVNYEGTRQYVRDCFSYGSEANRGMVASRILIAPFYMTSPVTLSGLGIDVKTVATTGTDMHLGLYIQDYTDNTFNLLDTTGPIDVSSGTGSAGFNTSSFAGGNMPLTPGLYYIAAGTDSDVTVDGINHSIGGPPFAGFEDDFSVVGHFLDGTYSSGLPTTLAAPSSGATQGNGVYHNAFGVLA